MSSTIAWLTLPVWAGAVCFLLVTPALGLVEMVAVVIGNV